MISFATCAIGDAFDLQLPPYQLDRLFLSAFFVAVLSVIELLNGVAGPFPVAVEPTSVDDTAREASRSAVLVCIEVEEASRTTRCLSIWIRLHLLSRSHVDVQTKTDLAASRKRKVPDVPLVTYGSEVERNECHSFQITAVKAGVGKASPLKAVVRRCCESYELIPFAGYTRLDAPRGPSHTT